MIYEYFLYYPSNLPKDGWIQGCFMCKKLISNYILEEIFYHFNNKYKFYVFLCNNCQSKILNDDYYKLYDKKYKKTLRKNFPKLF